MNAFKPGEPAISLKQHAKDLILDLMLDAAKEQVPSRRPDDHLVSSSESEFEIEAPESRKEEFRRVIDDYFSVGATGLGKLVKKMMNADQLDGKDRSIQSFAFIFFKLETYLQKKLARQPIGKKESLEN